MRVIAIINEKGGTGKTTLAVNFSSYFARYKKKRVLLLDLDSQGHAGKSLGFNTRLLQSTSADLLMNQRSKLAEALMPTHVEGLDVICAGKQLSEYPERMARYKDRELKLVQLLERLKPLEYHYVFIDSPPSLGLITRNIMVAATDIVVPVAPTYLSLDGCAEILDTIRETRERHPESKPKLTLVVPMMYRRTRLADEIIERLRAHFPREAADTLVRINVRIDEAQSHGQTIWDYDPRCNGAQMLEEVSLDLYKRLQTSQRSETV